MKTVTERFPNRNSLVPRVCMPLLDGRDLMSADGLFIHSLPRRMMSRGEDCDPIGAAPLRFHLIYKRRTVHSLWLI